MGQPSEVVIDQPRPGRDARGVKVDRVSIARSRGARGEDRTETDAKGPFHPWYLTFQSPNGAK